jgi:bacterioferritin
MGTKAREIVGTDVDKLIEKLQKAYADEWLAYFYYTLGAKLARGMEAKVVAEELERIAKEELEHVEELADRIIYLGGDLVRKWKEIEEIANCPSVEVPQDPKDLKGLIKAVVDGERCAIDVYHKILQDLGSIHKDPSTYHLIRHILDEEIEHEDTFENML